MAGTAPHPAANPDYNALLSIDKYAADGRQGGAGAGRGRFDFAIRPDAQPPAPGVPEG